MTKHIVIVTTKNLIDKNNIFTIEKDNLSFLKNHFLIYFRGSKKKDFLKKINNYINEDNFDEAKSEIKNLDLNETYKILVENLRDAQSFGNFLNEQFLSEHAYDKYLKLPLEEAIDRIQSESNRLKNRDKIFKVSKHRVYGYECYDENGNDILNNHGRENFISALVKDVAEIEEVNLDKKDSYKITLLLHRSDINVVNPYDAIDDSNKYLIRKNTELNQYSDNITTYTFSHRKISLIQKLINEDNDKFRFNNVQDLIQKIKNQITYRKYFSDNEKDFMKNFNEDSFNTLKTLLDNFSKTNKIY